MPKKKSLKKEIPKEAKGYKKQLECEIDADRERHGKKPFQHDDDKGDDERGTAEAINQETKTVTVSTTDPESGLFRKGEHETCFAYTVHTGCDRHNFILGVEVSAGNVHDSAMFDPIYDQLDKRFAEGRSDCSRYRIQNALDQEKDNR